MIETFIADKTWNKALCDMMRSIRMPGTIEITYARDPDFFRGVEILGKENKVMATTLDGELVLTMTMSSKPVYINKKRRNIGYLSSLRIAEDARGRMILGASYRYFKAIHDHSLYPVYLVSIIDSNEYAKKVFLRKKSYWLKNTDLGKYITYAVVMKKKRKPPRLIPGIEVVRGNSLPLAEIVGFLNEHGKEKQFFPAYESGDFHSPYLRDFTIKDFYIARENGDIAGVIGKWDQHTIKNNIIQSYHGLLKNTRPCINGILKMAGYHPLPGPGRRIRYCTASFICIKQNRKDILRLLLDHMLADAAAQGYHFSMIGFHEQDPLKDVMRHYISIPYESHLYCLYYTDGIDFINAYDYSLLLYIEGAAL